MHGLGREGSDEVECERLGIQFPRASLHLMESQCYSMAENWGHSPKLQRSSLYRKNLEVGLTTTLTPPANTTSTFEDSILLLSGCNSLPFTG